MSIKTSTRPKKPKNPRGLFERPRPGSGVWWINYYIDGVQHREKAGRKSVAIDLYRKRKDDARAKRKLVMARSTKAVLFGELIEDVLVYTSKHQDRQNYVNKGVIVGKQFGKGVASEITPVDLTRWLDQYKTNGTFNRYRSFLSLCFQQGIINKKVPENPARLVRHRLESPGRARFLSREEYDKVSRVIAAYFPEHVAEFIISVHTGMRLSEQYSVAWEQVHPERRAIDLLKTKNGYERTVHLNEDALAAIESLRRPGQLAGDKVVPRETQKKASNPDWFPEVLAQCKITDYVWHSNRHTFCSWLAMAGATSKDIQEAAGHKTIAMAARYSHLSPSHRLSIVERISNSTPSKQHAPVHAPVLKVLVK
jgi:integrase